MCVCVCVCVLATKINCICLQLIWNSKDIRLDFKRVLGKHNFDNFLTVLGRKIAETVLDIHIDNGV